jgi:periplasmic protein CpxP/Spy
MGDMLGLHCPRILKFHLGSKPTSLLTLEQHWNSSTQQGFMMKFTSKRLFLATIVMASCGYAGVASAQTAAPAPAGAQPQMQDKMHRGDGPSMRERFLGSHQEHMAERMAKRQAELKAKLKITPAQEGAWTTFTAAMKPPANMAGGMGMMHHDPKMKAEMDKLTTPERIDKMQAMRAERMKTMSAEMDKRGAATKAFYVVLSSEQKAVFDAVAMHAGEHGGKGDHGRMGHHN